MSKRHWLAVLLSLFLPTLCLAQNTAAAASQPAWKFTRTENKALPPVFIQGTAKRADQSEMTFFLGNFAKGDPVKKPLLIYVEGSGAQSHFMRVGEKIGMGLFGLIAKETKDYHVAATEKRGVEFASSAARGAGEGGSAEYNKYATMKDRVADLRLLLDTLLAEPNIDASCVLVVGHSEGADVVAVAAAEDPRITHAAFLSGGGPPQFYDFYLMRRKEMREQGAKPEEIEAAMSQLDGEIRAILDDPQSETKFWMGHAYKRWSTFATTSSAEHLAKAKAKLFLGHGSADKSVPIESFDYLVFELMRQGKRDVTAKRYAGCDHSFMKQGDEPSSVPFMHVLEEVLAWAAGK